VVFLRPEPEWFVLQFMKIEIPDIFSRNLIFLRPEPEWFVLQLMKIEIPNIFSRNLKISDCDVFNFEPQDVTDDFNCAASCEVMFE
jgi:hypothetical protein